MELKNQKSSEKSRKKLRQGENEVKKSRDNRHMTHTKIRSKRDRHHERVHGAANLSLCFLAAKRLMILETMMLASLEGWVVRSRSDSNFSQSMVAGSIRNF